MLGQFDIIWENNKSWHLPKRESAVYPNMKGKTIKLLEEDLSEYCTLKTL